MHTNVPLSKVYYHPIEAAIRWAGLLRFERAILSSISSPRDLPLTFDLPRWAELRLCAERIYDGILNGDLPFGFSGVTSNDVALIDSKDITVRHVDLKRWMREHYPEQRPGFLFSRSERIAHPCITLETGQAMLVERVAMMSNLEQCRRRLSELERERNELLKCPRSRAECAQCQVSDRAETTYLNIIGGMLELMLGQSPSGAPYSSFRTQESVVSALLAHHSGTMGIAERTLNGKFATARRRLRNSGT